MRDFVFLYFIIILILHYLLFSLIITLNFSFLMSDSYSTFWESYYNLLFVWFFFCFIIINLFPICVIYITVFACLFLIGSTRYLRQDIPPDVTQQHWGIESSSHDPSLPRLGPSTHPVTALPLSLPHWHPPSSSLANWYEIEALWISAKTDAISTSSLYSAVFIPLRQSPPLFTLLCVIIPGSYDNLVLR